MAIAAAPNNGYAIKEDGSLVGWPEYLLPQLPGGNDFVTLGGSGDGGVAIKEDRSLVGWADWQQDVLPPGNNFVAVSAGFWFGLGLREDGSLVGWGENRHGELNIPGGNRFVAVAAGNYHGLAIEVPEPGTLAGLAAAAGFALLLARRRIRPMQPCVDPLRRCKGTGTFFAPHLEGLHFLKNKRPSLGFQN